jgi:hypothetical protein
MMMVVVRQFLVPFWSATGHIALCTSLCVSAAVATSHQATFAFALYLLVNFLILLPYSIVPLLSFFASCETTHPHG